MGCTWMRVQNGPSNVVTAADRASMAYSFTLSHQLQVTDKLLERRYVQQRARQLSKEGASLARRGQLQALAELWGAWSRSLQESKSKIAKASASTIAESVARRQVCEVAAWARQKAYRRSHWPRHLRLRGPEDLH